MQNIVKKHLHENPSKSQLAWMYKDTDEFVENYEEFLVAVALTGCRLSQNFRTKCSRATLKVMQNSWHALPKA